MCWKDPGQISGCLSQAIYMKISNPRYCIYADHSRFIYLASKTKWPGTSSNSMTFGSFRCQLHVVLGTETVGFDVLRYRSEIRRSTRTAWAVNIQTHITSNSAMQFPFLVSKRDTRLSPECTPAGICQVTSCYRSQETIRGEPVSSTCLINAGLVDFPHF